MKRGSGNPFREFKSNLGSKMNKHEPIMAYLSSTNFLQRKKIGIDVKTENNTVTVLCNSI